MTETAAIDAAPDHEGSAAPGNRPHVWGFSLLRAALFASVLMWTTPLGPARTVTATGLQAGNLVVIANDGASGSLRLARYYMERRGVPESHLLRLHLTDAEVCTREEYERQVVPHVREFLARIDHGGEVRCLVTMYGVPLRILPPALRREERDQLAGLRQTQRSIAKQLKSTSEEPERKRLRSDLTAVLKQIRALSKADQGSAFDSELTLVRAGSYSLGGWIPNPMFIGYRSAKLEITADTVLMVSRLDGPTEQIVRRIVDDSVAAEKSGLTGTAYFDARWPRPDERKKPASAYASCDLSIHLAAERVQKSGRMRAIVDDGQALFKEGDCPDAALYCGWYSLARYIDAFSWKPGSVGYHIASQECETLHRSHSQVWCKRMLEKGVAATVGPVGEPYVQAFPAPDVFFGLLLEGQETLVECYAVSAPCLSWQMVLIGDPLYRPFRKS